MSHYVVAKSTMTSMESLEQALKELKFGYTKNGKVRKKQVDIALDPNLGFTRAQDGSFVLEGDPYYTTKYKDYYGQENKLVDRIATQYTICKVKKDLSSMNFTIEENAEGAIGPNGNIRMVAVRWN